MNYLPFLVTITCFLILSYTYWLWVNPKPRRNDKADPHSPTMFDVRRLLKEGDREAAIRLYMKLFKMSSQQARKDVEELERSLKV